MSSLLPMDLANTLNHSYVESDIISKKLLSNSGYFRFGQGLVASGIVFWTRSQVTLMTKGRFRSVTWERLGLHLGTAFSMP